MEDILKYLNSIHPLSSALEEHLRQSIKHREIHKKDLLLKAGHVCNHIYFIKKGLLRCFYWKDLIEVSAWFMKEGDICMSVESFFKQQKSFESIQAIEDCEVYYLDYKELQYIYRTYPEFNFAGRIVTETYYTLSEQRLYSLRMQKAPERYHNLMDNFPELIQRVPSKYLASYLGITEETLSRIRSKKTIS